MEGWMRIDFRTLTCGALGALAVAAAPAANALVYDAAADFSATNPSGVWSYGERVAPGGFIPLGPFQTGCYGQATINCFVSTTPAPGSVPVISKNVGPVAVFFVGTVVQPTNVLLMHPGPTTDAVLRFTAPTEETYAYSGFFQTLDLFPNGVILDINGAVTPFLGAPAVAGTLSGGGKFAFSGNVHLTAGQTFDLAVGRGGDYHFDSTGLSLQISPFTPSLTPEPAAWTMMILGFGLAGDLLRRRRAGAAVRRVRAGP
jgi:hypothetical protein